MVRLLTKLHHRIACQREYTMKKIKKRAESIIKFSIAHSKITDDMLHHNTLNHVIAKTLPYFPDMNHPRRLVQFSQREQRSDSAKVVLP
jgi:hypothetical protein